VKVSDFGFAPKLKIEVLKQNCLSKCIVHAPFKTGLSRLTSVLNESSVLTSASLYLSNNFQF